MCGIAGILDFDRTEAREDLLRRMLGLIRHRGPDAAGIYMDRQIGLAHARLSTVDLSGGDQPIHNEDRTIWVIYNGEIFNYPELRQVLEQLGHRFYTRSDTEVLVHLYEEKGLDLFQELNGQFAFALWDSNRKRLLLGRDRLGICPLFYFKSSGRLMFGSEIKALFADKRVPRTIDTQALSDVFTCWAPFGPLTAFKGIYQVPPGHFAVFSQKGFEVHPYWQLTFPPSIDDGVRPEEYVERFKELIHDAARIRLRGDVPVGAYLSGGLDSTYITSMVKKSFNNKLCTFSVSFADHVFDESAYQDRAVQALQTEHRRINCLEQDIGANFPRVIWHAEVPILRTAPAPLWQLSQLVRESNFKVVLTGEGSDEILAGYDIFKEDRVRRFWARQPDSRMRPRLLDRLYPDIFSNGSRPSRQFLEGFFQKELANIHSPAYSHLIRWGNTSKLKAFFSQDLQDEIEKSTPFLDRFTTSLPKDFMEWPPLSRAQYTEISIFLSNYLLSSQSDRVAMAHGVEGRFPFLDHRVVELAATIPPRYRMHGLKEKFILRKAAEDLISPELAWRPKQPYRAPISRCFLGNGSPEYVAELLSETALRETGYFDPARVQWLVQKCLKQDGYLLSERENMALVGILSTQLLDHMFRSHFPDHPPLDSKNIKVLVQRADC